MGYVSHLSRDPVMKRIVRLTGPVRVKKNPGACLFLCRSILSQQISTKAAQAIEARLLQLLPETDFRPEHLLEISQERLRTCGVSSAKAAYLHNVAGFFHDLELDDAIINRMSEESIIELLTQIKGVGRWTVEMLLMFSLGRKDVFPLDDYGIRQSMSSYYGLSGMKNSAMKQAMLDISTRWSPYRTYAALHLWRAKDNLQR
jgi:DNA-3-methyladenine glycosylase II